MNQTSRLLRPDHVDQHLIHQDQRSVNPLSKTQWEKKHAETSTILARKLLKRGNLAALDDLRGQILAFIGYYNRTIAKERRTRN